VQQVRWCGIFTGDDQVGGADPINDHPFNTCSFYRCDLYWSYRPMHFVCRSAVDDGHITSGVDQGSHWSSLNLNIHANMDSLSHAIDGSIRYHSSRVRCIPPSVLLLDPTAESQYVSWTPATPAHALRNRFLIAGPPLHSTPLTGRAIKPQRQGHIGGPIAQP